MLMALPLQAYWVPEYFRDDWLNEYHDMCRDMRSATVNDHIASSGAAAVNTTEYSIGHDDGQLAPASNSAPSRLAESDYRFVYLGPKASDAGMCSAVPHGTAKLMNRCRGLKLDSHRRNGHECAPLPDVQRLH